MSSQSHLWAAAPLFLGVVLAAGCVSGGDASEGTEGTGTDTGDTDTGGGPDPSDALFDPEHVVEVAIEIAPADWDALRMQDRSFEILQGEDCQAAPFGSPFTWFQASATVDGVALDPVGVRKKGFLGSLDQDKPSLKLDFQEYVPDVFAHGVKRMTLNNSKQDPSQLRQCLTYQMFNSAGIVAPRCNFAHVTVNGADLGTYVNVEPVKKPFLARNFTSDEGNLYEGTLSDFREGWLATFEKKTNKVSPDRSDLDRVAAALDGSDEGLVDRLSAEIDVDQFIDFWAMEVLTEHVDGYAANTNNFFVYRDPSDDRFRFLPWGVDGVLGVEDHGPPHSVKASGVVANRLYSIATTRDQYRARLQTFLDTVFVESELQAEIDRMEAIVSSIGGPVLGGDLPTAVADLREFVAGRRALIQDELDSAAPGWAEALRDNMCLTPTATIDVQFETTYGTLEAPDPFSVGTATLVAEFNGAPLVIEAIGSQAGGDLNESGTATSQIRVIAMLDTGDLAAVFFEVPPLLFTPATYPVEFGDVQGAALLLDPQAGDEGVTFVGSLFGDLILEQAGTGDTAPVVGSFVGEALLLGG